MNYHLINNGEQYIKSDDHYLSADMSDYNNTGTDISDYKYIDYGAINQRYDDQIAYYVGQPEYFSPYQNYIQNRSVHGSLKNNLSSDYGFVSITYDEYRQHSRTTANGYALIHVGGDDYTITNFASRNNITLFDLLRFNDNSGNAIQLGGLPAKNLGGLYTVEFTSANNSSGVRYNNNLWGILSPEILTTRTTGMHFDSYDIWYDDNVLVHPISGNWSATNINGYQNVDSAGFLKSGGYYYKNKRLIPDQFVKNSVKILFDLSNNYLYYCDINNDDYRVILSAKIPSSAAKLSNIKDFLTIENEYMPENNWGQHANCWMFKKNIDVKYLNCSFEDAVKYKPEDYVIHKDSVTKWPEFIISANNKWQKYIVPGNTTLYNTISDLPTSSFSNTGYYVLKVDVSANIKPYSAGVINTIEGNMLYEERYDPMLNACMQPYCYFTMPSAGSGTFHSKSFEGLYYIYTSGDQNESASFIASGIPRNPGSETHKLNRHGWIANDIYPSANCTAKAKWIFYKAHSNLQYDWTIEQQIDYCIYNDFLSAYIPMGFVRCSDGTHDKVVRNNDVYFGFGGLSSNDWHSSSASTTKYNVEFFHASSYYDALNG